MRALKMQVCEGCRLLQWSNLWQRLLRTGWLFGPQESLSQLYEAGGHERGAVSLVRKSCGGFFAIWYVGLKE